MTRTVSLSIDQLSRPQPGGIATYVRGLVHGLAALREESFELVGLAPRGSRPRDGADLELERVELALPLSVLTRVWAHWPLGVPSRSDVVHAASLAGPLGGGRREAVHSVALHDLLWRDEPSASTPRGVRFHEGRLQRLKGRDDVRLLTTAPGLKARLIDDGFASERLYESRLGVDDTTTSASREAVRELLAQHGVRGPYTLYAGTREPRKNLELLSDAHGAARASHAELGPLVFVGPPGWGEVPRATEVLVGAVARSMLKGLLRDATLFAYVPRAEGWGLPPVEALHAGTRVVASATTPSVARNHEVILVDPLSVESIARGLVEALALGDDDLARERRRASVADLTWRNVALDHLAAWR